MARAPASGLRFRRDIVDRAAAPVDCIGDMVFLLVALFSISSV
jgi:hypothetical protein